MGIGKEHGTDVPSKFTPQLARHTIDRYRVSHKLVEFRNELFKIAEGQEAPIRCPRGASVTSGVTLISAEGDSSWNCVLSRIRVPRCSMAGCEIPSLYPKLHQRQVSYELMA